MKKIKVTIKAQDGKKVVAKKTTVAKKKKSSNPADASYKGLKDAWGNDMGGEGTNPPFKKNGGKINSKKK